MHRLAFPPLPRLAIAALDGVAILAFTVAGVVSHRGSLPPSALLEDALPLLVGWYAASLLFHLYSRSTVRALLLTWALGIPLGVLLRAAVLGRLDEPRQFAFLVTTLILSLVFVLGTRALAALIRNAPSGQ